MGLLEGLLGQWEQGAPYRQAALGLLQGDSQPVRQMLNKKTKINPMSQEEALAFALDYAPMGLGTIGKAKKLTKYEKAHLKAQKNAVKMLGLPPNNTAMDRAKAMGFKTDMPLYHGTAEDFNAFKLFEDPNLRTSKSEVGKLGVSTALDPRLANEFASRAGSDRSNVMPLFHRMTKGASVELPSEVSNDQVWATVLDAYKDNYDALKFANYNSNTLKNQEFILHRHPEMLRSRFAAFDPAKANVAPAPRCGRGLKLVIQLCLAPFKIVAPAPRCGRGLKHQIRWEQDIDAVVAPAPPIAWRLF